MAVNVHSSGVFPDISVAAGIISIPLANVRYQGGTISSGNAEDYRALLRGIDQTYYDFMTGTATGTDNPDDFNKPAYFSMDRRKPTVAGTDALPLLSNTTSAKFTYKLDHGGSDGLDLPSE